MAQNALATVRARWGQPVDRERQMPAIVAVKNRYVRPPFPAWTAVGVTRLIPGSGITEIRVIASRVRR